MRHNRQRRKLAGRQAHRKMMYRNLVTSLFQHERIQTTAPKAKEARAVAERLITFAKRGDLHSRRMAARKVNEPVVLQKLFEEIGPRYAERPGGYTRILRMAAAARRQRGDGDPGTGRQHRPPEGPDTPQAQARPQGARGRGEELRPSPSSPGSRRARGRPRREGRAAEADEEEKQD